MATIKSNNFVYLVNWEEMTIGVFSTPAKAAAAKREFIEREGFEYDEDELDVEAMKVDEIDDDIFRETDEEFDDDYQPNFGDDYQPKFIENPRAQAPLSIRITSWLLIGLLIVTLLLGANSCVKGIYHFFAH